MSYGRYLAASYQMLKRAQVKSADRIVPGEGLPGMSAEATLLFFETLIQEIEDWMRQHDGDDGDDE